MNCPYLNSHLRKERVNCQGPNRLFLLFQPTKHVPLWQNLPNKKRQKETFLLSVPIILSLITNINFQSFLNEVKKLNVLVY